MYYISTIVSGIIAVAAALIILALALLVAMYLAPM
ncbi:hypothetical protein ES703_76207 [subsurface metagenome]|jgi:hypothetical protein